MVLWLDSHNIHIVTKLIASLLQGSRESLRDYAQSEQVHIRKQLKQNIMFLSGLDLVTQCYNRHYNSIIIMVVIILNCSQLIKGQACSLDE